MARHVLSTCVTLVHIACQPFEACFFVLLFVIWGGLFVIVLGLLLFVI